MDLESISRNPTPTPMYANILHLFGNIYILYQNLAAFQVKSEVKSHPSAQNYDQLSFKCLTALSYIVSSNVESSS